MASSRTVCMEPRGRGVINTKSSIFVGTCKKGNKTKTSKTKQNKKTQPLNIFSKASCPLTEDSAYSSGPGPSSWTGGSPRMWGCPFSTLAPGASSVALPLKTHGISEQTLLRSQLPSVHTHILCTCAWRPFLQEGLRCWLYPRLGWGWRAGSLPGAVSYRS